MWRQLVKNEAFCLVLNRNKDAFTNWRHTSGIINNTLRGSLFAIFTKTWRRSLDLDMALYLIKVHDVDRYVLYKIWAADLYEKPHKVQLRIFYITKKQNHFLSHSLLKHSTKNIYFLRKFKLKLYVNQDESLADLKTRSWLSFGIVLSLINYSWF